MTSDSFSSLAAKQCQSFFTMLQAHLSKAKLASGSSSTTSHVAGIYSSFKPDANSWVIDSGASTHICYEKKFFTNLRFFIGMSMRLSNHTRIDVSFVGDVCINSHIYLQNVMFIPSFQFNFISISALTAHLHIMVQFVDNSCVI